MNVGVFLESCMRGVILGDKVRISWVQWRSLLSVCVCVTSGQLLSPTFAEDQLTSDEPLWLQVWTCVWVCAVRGSDVPPPLRRAHQPQLEHCSNCTPHLMYTHAGRRERGQGMGGAWWETNAPFDGFTFNQVETETQAGASWRQQNSSSIITPAGLLLGAPSTPPALWRERVALYAGRFWTFHGDNTMEPLCTDTGAPVRHANTYSDVGDHVAFGVDPPCDRQFFLSCSLLSARLSERSESVWIHSSASSRSGIVLHYPSIAPKRWAGKKRIQSFHLTAPPQLQSPSS